jgi:threonine/homoserine/homoserine lactone efflux protein
MDYQLLLTFFIAITLLTIAPGADTVIVMRNALRGGFKDGAVTSFGICSGLFVHATLSAGGLSLILFGPADLFDIIKLAGAIYLGWMGFQNLRKAYRGYDTQDMNTKQGKFRPVRSFYEGFISNVLNPKTVVFYIAFLPQFIQPQYNPFLQAMAYAGAHFILSMIWQCLIALMVNKAKVWLHAPVIRRRLDVIVGSALIIFGLKLAMQNK